MKPHGTNARYQLNGCRCEACREAHREAGARYNGNRRAKRVPDHNSQAHADAIDAILEVLGG